ncbi:hypothetical protein B5M09_004893 [Aphanomyces astaci]|uniref:peptidylprolyl isomerase n=1 Tax=Aphanomyces astaci TaxID=112090 RepID=A0A3R7W1A2_APHAT|nr:hypothetical protein B5M09_004893 [Aphanomyces astaci]
MELSKTIGEQSIVGVKVDLATQCKAQGNEAFKSKEFRRAEGYYKKGLQFLEAPQTCQYSQEELMTVGPVLATLHVNIAACCLQGSTVDSAKCILHCTQHDPLNVKAWYRRSQAFMKQKEFALAKDDVTHALGLDQQPSTSIVTLRRHLVALQAASAKVKAAEIASFQHIFRS